MKRRKTEAEALWDIVIECAETGRRGVAVDTEGLFTWTVETDSKVDDKDPTFPVIVHMGQRP